MCENENNSPNRATDDDLSEDYLKCSPVKVLSLFESLSSTTDSLDLQIKINKYLQELTESPNIFLVPLLPSSEEGLIQVINDQVLDKEIRFSVNPGCDFQNAPNENGCPFQITDTCQEFKEMIEMVVGNQHNTLIFDIKHPKTSKLQAQQTSSETINKIDSNHQQQQQQQEHQTALFVCIAGDNAMRSRYEFHVNETFRYVTGHLLMAIELFEEKRVRGQCQNLLKVARRLLVKIGDLGQLLRGVMAEAKDLTNAERCSLFLIDKYSGELVSKVFDGNEASKEVRIDGGKGIAGHVAQTGKLLNIRNAYLHPLFYKGVDESTGFKTRNILCFPICDEEGIIGVAQLCNKLDGFHFDKCDEETATAFSVYCGISIMHALVHKQVQKAEARYKLSQELLLYHMKVPECDVKTLMDTSVDDGLAEQFAEFIYCPRDLPENAQLKMALFMFNDLKFCTRFCIREDNLARFILMVQKGYRKTPYHNWAHAFSVAHFSYCCLKRLQLMENEILTPLQGMSLLIACFCHDLDHRGTSNSYQTQSSSPLARLYSSEGSVNERHHLSQAICILNEANCKILDGLTTEEFKECIDCMRELILATDLANHFRILRQLKQLRRGELMQNQRLLMSLIITCCDLNDQVKSWSTVQQVAELVYAEFFAQGDLERQMGLRPNKMMDRQKACIPALQIEFLTTVIRPTFEILVRLFPECEQFLDIIDTNRRHWEERKQQDVNEQEGGEQLAFVELDDEEGVEDVD